MTTQNDLTDEKIGALIDQKVADAISWYSSKLSTERQKVLEYIDRKLPKPYHPNGSKWVNPAVYSAVEYMRAQLGDTFSAGSGIVTFDALNAQDVETARIASEYANHVFYSGNQGEKIIREAIFDGLTARVGIAKVWWEPDHKDEEISFENVGPDEIQFWVEDESIVHLEVDENDNGSFSGRLVKRCDCGSVKVEVVNPEEFAIDKRAKELSDRYFCVHYTHSTIDDLISDYPDLKGREDELRAGQGDDFSMSPEVLARFHDTTAATYLRADDVQDELTSVMVAEAYCRFKKKGDLAARLYKVIRCGKVNIVVEPVDELPFVVFTPIPRPHIFYGECYAKTVMPTQDILTAAQRSIIDHAMMTNNPRWMVAKGGLVNPRELLDNRLGGIVNVKDLNSIEPIQAPAMNPMLFSLVQGMEQLTESITGISAASIGLNKDVISKQNSAALMEQQTGNSQIRQKEIARNFASQFLIPLFEKINRLVVRFEKNEKIIEVAGNYVPVQPWTWLEDRAATASAHLGFGEKESQARKIAEFFVALKQNGGDVFTGYEGFYNGLSDMLTLEGRRVDIQRYLPITPDKIQPPQPDPKTMAEIEKLQAETQAVVRNSDTTSRKVDQHGELQALKLQLQKLQAELNAQKTSAEEKRKDIKTASDIDVAQREMYLLENPPAETESRGIISP